MTEIESSVLSMLERRRIDNPITYGAIADKLNCKWRTIAKAVHDLRQEPIVINGDSYHIGTSKRRPYGAFLERGDGSSRMLLKTGAEMIRTARRIAKRGTAVEPSLFEEGPA